MFKGTSNVHSISFGISFFIDFATNSDTFALRLTEDRALQECNLSAGSVKRAICPTNSFRHGGRN